MTHLAIMTPLDDTERGRSRKRFDALSLFLGACMVTLLAMYALDAWQAEQLATHDVRAARLNLGPLKGPCTAMATGSTGDMALLVCANTPRTQAREMLKRAWAQTPPPPWLTQIALRDRAGTLVCPRTLQACTDHDLLARDAMKASRRRPARQ